MNGMQHPLDVGWQARPPALALACAAGVFLALLAAVRFGPMAGLVVVLACALAAMTRMQWAAIDGHALVLRDAGTGYAYRALPARQVSRLRFRRSASPWCRLRLERDGHGICLVLAGPSPAHSSIRPVTMWIIVHGRRRVRIDPCLLDALAAMPEHDATRQPHDASPA